MTNDVAQRPHSGAQTPPTRNPRPWIDLIAFLAVLALVGVLIALGRITAGSLVTVCAALGGLYEVWRRMRSLKKAPLDPPLDEAAPADEPDKGPGELAA